MGEADEAREDDTEVARDEVKAKRSPKKKKRKKRKRSPDKASDASERGDKRPAKGSGKSKTSDPSKAKSGDGDGDKGEGRRRRPWWVLLLVIGLVELFLFGSRGRMRICVAHEGEHDFALVDQPRTEENTRQYPTCVKRTNVGIVSHYDEVLLEATGYACQRAAVLRPTSVLYQCILKQDGWQHRIETEFVPPWDPIYYRRLFWFAFDK